MADRTRLANGGRSRWYYQPNIIFTTGRAAGRYDGRGSGAPSLLQEAPVSFSADPGTICGARWYRHARAPVAARSAVSSSRKEKSTSVTPNLRFEGLAQPGNKRCPPSSR